MLLIAINKRQLLCSQKVSSNDRLIEQVHIFSLFDDDSDDDDNDYSIDYDHERRLRGTVPLKVWGGTGGGTAQAYTSFQYF